MSKKDFNSDGGIIEIVIYIIGAILSGILWLLGKKAYEAVNPKAEDKSLVILGMPGAGKTAMWHKLQGKDLPKRNTSGVAVPRFKLGDGVWVDTSVDIAGTPTAVGKYYETLIKADSYIYFLIDAQRLNDDEYVEDAKDRLDLARSIKIRKCKEREQGNEDKPLRLGCMKLVVTHMDLVNIEPQVLETTIAEKFGTRVSFLYGYANVVWGLPKEIRRELGVNG